MLTSCWLQYTHRFFTTTYPHVVHCNILTSCSPQYTHRFLTTTHPQIVHGNTPTCCSLQHTHRLFTTTHPHVVHCTYTQVDHYNIHSGCSLQHTHRFLNTTYTQVVHYNTSASGSLYITPTCDYCQLTSCSVEGGKIVTPVDFILSQDRHTHTHTHVTWVLRQHPLNWLLVIICQRLNASVDYNSSWSTAPPVRGKAPQNCSNQSTHQSIDQYGNRSRRYQTTTRCVVAGCILWPQLTTPRFL